MTRVCRAIERHRVELLPTTPSFLNLLLAARANERFDLSSLRRVTYGTEVMAQATLDRLRAALPQVTLQQTYGLSEVGVLAANREPGLFERLILIGPSPRYINDAPAYVGGFERSDIEGLLETMEKNYIGWANFLAPVIMKNPDHPELTSELVTSFCSTDPVVARRFAEATFFADNRSDLAAVEVPSLIMQCSDDMIAPAAVGEYVSRELRGSTLRHLRATGHCPHMSHPKETVAVMREYLRSPVDGAQSVARIR